MANGLDLYQAFLGEAECTHSRIQVVANDHQNIRWNAHSRHLAITH